MDKKAKLNQGILNTALLGIVLLVVLFQIYAQIVPEGQAAGDLMGDSARCSSAGGTYNASATVPCGTNSSLEATSVAFGAIPLSGLFSGTGIVFLIIMAALVLLVVKSYLKTK